MNGLMTTGRFHAHGPRSLARLCTAVVPLLSGCVSDQQKYDAIVAVNQEFRAQYEATLAEKGTRDYALRRDDALSSAWKDYCGPYRRQSAQPFGSKFLG